MCRSSRRTWTSSSWSASRAAPPGRLRRSPCARPTASRRGRAGTIRERVLGLTARQAKLWKKLRPHSPRRRSRSRRWATRRRRAARARGAVPAGDLPGADAARRRARAAVPVHLRALAQPRRARPRPGDRRGAVRARQGAGGPAALLPGRLERPAAAARERDRPLPRPALPRHGDRGAAVFRVTRDADFEVSDEADDLLEAVELELRRRRFGDVVRLEVSSSTSARCSSGSSRGSARPTIRSTRCTASLDLADLEQIVALDRPELKDEPSLGATPAAAGARQAAARPLRRDPPRRLPRPPAVRVVRRQLRGLRPAAARPTRT